MEYNFREIEKKWQDEWKQKEVYKVSNDSPKPKYYVLDMFPYPSGAGLHVGHPLGYIASDIFARYKRLKGYNVLHPMGYDAFGLPAEQYAIEHGIHPAVSTAQNIENFRKQLDKIGFCFDWSREVKTSDPQYYKWTQWIFLQLFKSFYNRQTRKAESITRLVEAFEKEGNKNHPVPDARFEIRNPNFEVLSGNFSADQWMTFDEKTQQDIIMEYRLAYCGYGEVNWCEALGTVLANDEVINGVSERGGYPVVKKKLRQWYLRITEYADRLLEGLQRVDFSDAMKEMQSNWIGKSFGSEIDFVVASHSDNLSAASPPAPLLAERGVSPEENNADDETQTGNYYQTANSSYWNILKEFGRENRKNQTEAENILWQRLRNNQLDTKVRRQHAIQGYIVDFALLQVNLIVEIDGEYHNEVEQKRYDDARTAYLKEYNLELIRFTNDEVINSTESVIETIKKEISKKKDNLQGAVATPLSARRGAGGEAAGTLLFAKTESVGEATLKVYTTRPDTIFGVDFMVIAPEHELIKDITSAEQKQAVDEYIAYVKSRSDRERQAEKKISGCFTGAYAINPFNKKEIPIWISEYVLAGYGTGAIMAVPCGDERDFKFAKHFNIPISNIIGEHFNGDEANATKDAKLTNSDFLNGIVMRDAIEIVNNKIEELGIGKKKVNYKMRDAAFSRQRYWGEPFPIIWKDGIAYPLDEKELPLLLPEVEKYGPGPDGEGPLANLEDWAKPNDLPSALAGGQRETNTMPGYAGSSWYFLRYMDPHNNETFCDRKASDYWGQVDLYIGGTEHAVGHLLYSRLWTKALYDLGFIGHDEPYKKLVNQGMIQGSSRFVYRGMFSRYVDEGTIINNVAFVSKSYYDLWLSKGGNENPETELDQIAHEITDLNISHIVPIHVNVNIVDGLDLDIEKFKLDRNREYEDAEFILEDGKYICGTEVEKMSKSKLNSINPDDLVTKYGADTFRMYEMFLGPVEQSKPWDTKGIEGVHRFLKKLWRLFYDEIKGKVWKDEKANDAELKVLHKTIKKIEEDTERFSFNTGVSAFMIAVNELADLKCYKKEVLEKLLILLTPYAPHIAEELWHLLGNEGTILDAAFPKSEEKYLIESTKNYPVALNGKTKSELNISLDATQAQVEAMILANETVQKWLEGKQPKKIIYVKNKMINVVT